MHLHSLDQWTHDHVFGQDKQRAGERRTLAIVILTALMMIIEIAAGLIYGSMALLADGLHMGSHATALSLTVFAYVISRRLASDSSFAFGVGKINSLAGFASAIMLLGFSLLMVTESAHRLIEPTAIAFDQALIVAVLGLVVNAVSAQVLMSTPHEQDHHQRVDQTQRHKHDHNLRAAYLHVLADALTSLFAIVALLAGKYFGAAWLDPVMGIVGASLVARWSYSLIRETSRVLLDKQVEDDAATALREEFESGSSDRIVDLHLWSIGPGIRAAEIALVTHDPQPIDRYKSRIPEHLRIAHSTIEVHVCSDDKCAQ